MMARLLYFVDRSDTRNRQSWDSLMSHVIKQRHEPEIQVKLLVAVEQGQARIVRNKVDVDCLVSTHHHDVFQDASRFLSSDARNFKNVPMQVNRMDVVTGIPHANAVTLAFFQVEGRGHHLHIAGIRGAVDLPAIEALVRGVRFGEGQVECWLRRGATCSDGYRDRPDCGRGGFPFTSIRISTK